MTGAMETVVLSAYGVLLGTAALADIAYLRIPNVISLSLVVLFFAAALVSPQPVNWGSHLAAGGIVLAVGMGLFAWGKIGGGDVKLISAAALWNGLTLLPSLLLAIGVIGGLVAVVWLVLRRSGMHLLLETHGMPTASLQSGVGIPYAVAIAAGCLLLLPDLPLLR